MVGVFRRSISFPNKNPHRPSSSSSSSQKPHLSHHIRSISLPSRSHPLISQIKEDLSNLATWHHPQAPPLTAAKLSHALTVLKETHETLQQILHLPQTLDSLRSRPRLVENLLEHFLRFVDAYGTFQTSLLALKEHHSSAQIALRKRDESKFVAYAKAKNKLAKEIHKLACGLRSVTLTHQHPALHPSASSVADAEVRHVIADVIRATVSVSVALFNGIAVSLASPRTLSWTQMVKLSRKGSRVKENEGVEELERCSAMESLRNLKKKGEEEVRSVLKRMREFEECMCAIQNDADQVLRAFINSRVALLNTLTLTH